MKAILKIYEQETLEDYFKKEITWTLSEKLEYNITLNNGEKIINYSDIDNVKMVLFSGDGVYKVRVSTSSDSITYTVDGVFIFTPSTLTNITEIALVEDNETDVTVTAIFYGESQES